MEHFSDLLVVLFTQYVSENLLNIKACFCLIMSLNPNWTCCECNVVSVTLTLCSSAGVNDLSNVSSTLSFKTGPALYFCKNWITNYNKKKQTRENNWLAYCVCTVLLLVLVQGDLCSSLALHHSNRAHTQPSWQQADEVKGQSFSDL